MRRSRLGRRSRPVSFRHAHGRRIIHRRPGSAVPAESAPSAAGAVLKLQGPFAFDQTGILASFATPLADAGIGIFTVSTFDTDYLLVKTAQLA